MIAKLATIVALILIASLSVAGCTSSTNPATSSPSSVSNVPTAIPQKATVEPTAKITPTQTQDYAQYLRDQMAGYGFVVSNLTKISSNTYHGTNYTPTGREQTTVTQVAIETYGSESAAKNRYDQWISDKSNEGYLHAEGISYSPKISAKEQWTGNKPPLGGCYARYVYNTNIQLWVVTTETWDTIENIYL